MRELDWEPTDTSIEEAALVKARILQDVAVDDPGAKDEVGLSGESQPGARPHRLQRPGLLHHLTLMGRRLLGCASPLS